MTADGILKKYENMTADEIISQLEKEYSGDADALEEIEQAKKTIDYIKRQTDYKGQTPRQAALSCAGSLAYWN